MSFFRSVRHVIKAILLSGQWAQISGLVVSLLQNGVISKQKRYAASEHQRGRDVGFILGEKYHAASGAGSGVDGRLNIVSAVFRICIYCDFHNLFFLSLIKRLSMHFFV